MREQLIAFVGASGAWTLAMGGVGPSFVGIGAELNSPFYSQPNGLSGDGSTVVGQTQGPGGADDAFLWTRSGGMQAIPDLPGGRNDAQFFGASGDGSVAVGHGNVFLDLSNHTEAVRWTASTGLQTLGFLTTNGNYFSQAYGVSRDGQAIIGYSSSQARPSGEAFRWTQGSGMQGLGVLGGLSGQYSIATGANSDGSVIVGVSSFSSGSLGGAFKWTQSGGIAALPKPDGWSNTTSAVRVSPDGQYIVGDGYLGNSVFRTILWTPQGATTLPTIPGSISDHGEGVSGDGSTVVGLYEVAGQSNDRLFYWTKQTGMVDLRTYLTGLGLNLNGWTFTAIHGISDDGLTIVGEGLDPAGNNEGWVAVVPSPGATSLVLGFGLSMMRRRRVIDRSM